MNFVAAIVAIVAFSVGLVLSWDAGFTLGATRALYVGLIALSLACVLPALAAWPWKA
jgi:hypothetical protein